MTDRDPTREVSFFVPGDPRPERKRQRIVTGKDGRQFIGARTDEPDRKDWKAVVRMVAWQAFGEGPWQGPLELTLTFAALRPASWPKKPTKTNPWPGFPWRRPDLSNYTKIVEDAMNGVAWLDDAQVCREVIEKVWANAPGVKVTVRRLTDD